MGDHKPQEREARSEHEPTPQKAVTHAAKRSAEPSASVAQRIAAAPLVDFGDLIVAEVGFQNVAIFNQDQDLAFLSAQIEGSSAFQIVSKPDQINPSASGYDPTAAVRVAYSSHARSVDKGFLAVTLQWRDGSRESIRVALQGSAHGGGELSDADEKAEVAAKQEQHAHEEEKAKAADAERKRIRSIQAKGGAWETPIQDAAERLGSRLRTLGAKQQNGVTEAAALVAAYKRKPPAPPSADVVIELATLALTIASAGLSTAVAAGIKAVLGEGGEGWTPRTSPQHMLGATIPGAPGSKQLAGSPAGAIAAVAKKLIETGKTQLKPKRSARAATSGAERTQSAAAEDMERQVEYFSLQRDMVAERLGNAEENAIHIKESLIQFNNPRDALKAATVVEQVADVVREQGETARKLQAAESTKGWIRLLSHSSLGSVSAANAHERGLKETKDGSATAQIDHAHADKPYDGVIELEFDADVNHAGAAVRIASARLFGVSNAAAKQLHLDTQPLRSAGLAIRARSSHASSPVHVSISRDEAGNVRYSDESGAVGMRTPWLARRGGRPGSASAAQRAAKELIDELAGQNLEDLGVPLETDGTDV